jgi:hypothetical protein
VRDGIQDGRDPLSADDADAVLATPTEAVEDKPASQPQNAMNRWSGGTVGSSGHLTSVDPARAVAPIRSLLVVGFGGAWTALGVWGDSVGLVVTGAGVTALGVYWAAHQWTGSRAARRLERGGRAQDS